MLLYTYPSCCVHCKTSKTTILHPNHSGLSFPFPPPREGRFSLGTGNNGTNLNTSSGHVCIKNRFGRRLGGNFEISACAGHSVKDGLACICQPRFASCAVCGHTTRRRLANWIPVVQCTSASKCLSTRVQVQKTGRSSAATGNDNREQCATSTYPIYCKYSPEITYTGRSPGTE